MKIVWLSANKFGYELLREAIRFTRINPVITLSERATTKMYDCSNLDKKRLEILTSLHKIKLIKTEHINNEVETLKEIKPDYIIVAGWRQIISQEILDIPKYGVIGFHPTPLPLGRGPAPIINSILLGWRGSASTMFFYNDKVDAGDIIFQEYFEIESTDYAIDVYNKYIEASKKLLHFYLPLLEDGELARRPQDESKATYFPKRTLQDNQITMFDSIEMIDRKIRAFSKPYLGAFIKRNGKKLIIERCHFEED